MSWPEIVYVCRHADRVWDLKQPPYMSATVGDVPLTAHGRDQARELADFLAGLPEDEQPQLILSSLCHRALETAEPIVRRLKIPLRLEPGLT